MNVTCMTETAEGGGASSTGFIFWGSRWRANARKMANTDHNVCLY